MLTAYVAIWSSLAVASIGYLTIAATFPEQVSAIKLSPVTGGDSEALQALNHNLRIELDAVRNELVAVRRQRAEAEDQARSLASELAALATPQTRAAEPPAGAEPRTAPIAPRVLNAGESPPASVPIETGSIVASLKPSEKPVAEKPLAEPLAAGPAARKDPAQRTAATTPRKAESGFGTTEVKPKQAAVGLLLGASSSLDMARLNWSILADQNQELKGLQPRVAKSDARGAADPYTLIAGPVGSREEAQRLCGTLEQRGVSCKVSGFGGDAL